MSTPTRSRELLIVDDEAPARERLERLIGEIPGWVCAGTCASGVEVIDRVAAARPDVVLLDIEMPGMTGIEVAHRLGRLDSPPAIVFTTAYDQFALDAFDSKAAGYVLKPVRRERLLSALEHAARLADAMRREPAAVRDRLAIRLRDEVRLVPVADIRYFQADRKYTTVCHSSGADLIEISLKQLEQEFGTRFVRIHRNALVAVRHVERLERLDDGSYQVCLRGTGTRLPVSRRQLGELRARLDSGR